MGVEVPRGFGLFPAAFQEHLGEVDQAIVTFLGCRVGKVQTSSLLVCHWLILAYFSAP